MNALPGNGVHVVTVNEYLAQRDADWMGPVYRFLGLEVGVIKSNQPPDEKQPRLRLRTSPTARTTSSASTICATTSRSGPRTACSAKLVYAIVDEVDSILIDEARTPLIISGRSEESTELYVRINHLLPQLKLHSPPPGKANDEIESTQVELVGLKGESLGTMSTAEALAKAKERGLHVIEVDASAKPARAQLFTPGDYTIDEKQKQAHLTEEGHEKVEELFAQRRAARRGREPLRRRRTSASCIT